MAQAKSPQDREKLLRELNLLIAFKKVAETQEGMIVLNHIIKTSQLDCDAYKTSKNSGDTANILGMQTVGRDILDKLIEADVDIDISLFSKKKRGKISRLRKEIEIKLKNKEI